MWGQSKNKQTKKKTEYKPEHLKTTSPITQKYVS